MGRVKDRLLIRTEELMGRDCIKYSHEAWKEYSAKAEYELTIEDAEAAGDPIAFCNECECRMPVVLDHCKFCGWEI